MSGLLIQGEAEEALDSMLPAWAGTVQCIYVDPPYNTGEEIRSGPGLGYRDRRSHEDWMAMMRPLLSRWRELLHPSGSLFVQLNGQEIDYLKVALDEVFGRQHFLNRITVQARSASAFSTVNPGLFKASEYLLWYARDRSQLQSFQLRVPRAPDPAYRLFLSNPEDPCEAWRILPLRRACPPGRRLEDFQVERAAQVCRLASIASGKAGKATAALKERSRAEPDRVFRQERPGRAPRYIWKGQQLIFYDRQVREIDGRLCATRLLTDLWTDLRWEGIAAEGGVTFKKGKKPEALIRRCLQLSTRPGQRVLDCFLGSGTTAAVAHKMGRSWVGIERSPANLALAQQRLRGVCAGEDQGGISSVEGWAGGGEFQTAVLGKAALPAPPREG